ncbi:MAG: tRNA pseudouridine(55) synthase TruB [Gemmobacter sp.]
MSRRRKGQPVSGWVVIDKPAGMTSTDVVNTVRRALDAQKAGHAGTLDPAATGLLAVALGEATNTVPFDTDAHKCYEFSVRFGASTTTDDAEGEILATSALRPDDAAIEAALGAFRGDIAQVPPQFSAVRVEGARAYDLAREGVGMDLAARPLHVAELVLLARPDPDTARLRMVCGKGGYVRAIARDLGAALGCLGHVTALRRVWAGPFDLGRAVAPEAIADAEVLGAALLPLEAALAGLPEARCTPGGAVRLRNGNPGEVLATDARFGDVAWGSFEGRAVAIGRYMGGLLHPDRVFAAAGAEG